MSVEMLSLQVDGRVTPTKSGGESPSPFMGGVSLRLSSKERLALLDQFAILLDSGIQIPAALESMLLECTQPRAAAVLTCVRDDVLSGRPLSESMGRLPKAFPRLVSEMVHAGEASGMTAEMLRRTVDMLEGDALLRSKIRSALLYPAIMVVLTMAVVAFLLTVIVPKFQRLFEKKAATLPAPTQLLLSVGDFCSEWGLWILIGIAALATAAFVYGRTEGGRRVMDDLFLKMPLVGRVYGLSVLARTVRTLGLLVQSGVPVHMALGHARDVASSPAYVSMWERLREHIVNGGTLTEALRDSPLVSPTFRQVVSAGEATAHLDRAMLKTADQYSRELERKTRDIVTVIEPLMVVVMGAIVGFIAMSIMLPIFRLSSS